MPWIFSIIFLFLNHCVLLMLHQCITLTMYKILDLTITFQKLADFLKIFPFMSVPSPFPRPPNLKLKSFSSLYIPHLSPGLPQPFPLQFNLSVFFCEISLNQLIHSTNTRGLLHPRHCIKFWRLRDKTLFLPSTSSQPGREDSQVYRHSAVL